MTINYIFFIMLYLNDHKSSEDLFDFCPENKRLFLWTCNWKQIFLCISQTLCDVKKRMPWNVTALNVAYQIKLFWRKVKHCSITLVSSCTNIWWILTCILYSKEHVNSINYCNCEVMRFYLGPLQQVLLFLQGIVQSFLWSETNPAESSVETSFFILI